MLPVGLEFYFIAGCVLAFAFLALAIVSNGAHGVRRK